MTTFRPGDRVHLKGHAHAPATTGTVITENPTAVYVTWDDNDATTPHHPQHLEPAGEPMSHDPRIEAAAKALYAHPVSNGSGKNAPEIITQCEDAARAALAAADKAVVPASERLASAVRALRDYREGSPSLPLPFMIDELIAAHNELPR